MSHDTKHCYNGNVQVHNYLILLHDSNLNDFQTFWPRLSLLHLIDVLWIPLDCNFIPQIRLLHFQIFHSTNSTTAVVRMSCEFPLVVVFATLTSGRFVKLKCNKVKQYINASNLTKQSSHSRFFRGMPVAGHGKVSPDFLFLCRCKTANLIDK